MNIEKIKEIIDTNGRTIIVILTIFFAIYTYLSLGNRPETFIAIATIALVAATIYLAYFNQKLWYAQDKPCLILDYITTDTPIELADGVYSDEEFRKNIFVKNIGKGHAFKIKFELHPRFSKQSEYFFDVLPSGDKKHLRTLDSLEFKTSNISYYDINGKKINQLPYSRTQDTLQIGKTKIRF